MFTLSVWMDLRACVEFSLSIHYTNDREVSGEIKL